MSSNLHRNSTEANKHTPKGFDLADNNSTLLRDERGQSRYIENLVNERVENLVDGFNAPPTTTSGHLYVLIDNGSGTVNTDWQGANYDDIVRIQDGVWVAITPVNGYLVFNKADEKYYKFGSTGWVEFIPESENIYTNDGTIGSNRVATLTDTLSFSGGRVSFDTTTNGILLPRLTTVQMNGISSPATNLLVYNTDLNGIYRYNGSSWVALSSGYGIIGVYSGSGNGTPVFFADLQSALETCKASGGYFTVKLYSNITITSAIEIDYTGTGVGNAYLFRQLTIDFNGFSVTNAQANTSDAFTVELSNSASVYQEIKFINGAVLRTNGTGTHHALKCNTAGRFGAVQMSKMFWYCQNSITMALALDISSNIEANKICDLGGSTFISNTNTAINCNNNLTTVINFNAIARGSENTVTANNGVLSFFTAENTSTGNGVNITSNAIARDFTTLSNSGSALRINTGSAFNLTAMSISGIAINANIANCTIDNFYAKTGNNFAIQVLGSFDNNSNFSNGKCENNGATECAQFQNFGSAHNIEATNYGSGFGLDIRNGQESRCEVTQCKGTSIGGIGGVISSSSASSIVSVDNCYFISHWNNAGGHALRINNSTGVVLLTKSHMKVRNASANAIHATAPRTVRSRYCTHNDVATTPINANVIIVLSGIIS